MAYLIRYLRRHHVALVALFVALGGSAYAAHLAARNSVTSQSIRNGAIHSVDLSKRLDAALRGRCPSKTRHAAADLCVTRKDVASAGWVGAQLACAKIGMRLPSAAEAMLLVQETPADNAGGFAYWTDSFYMDPSGASLALEFSHSNSDPHGELATHFDNSVEQRVRCVTSPRG